MATISAMTAFATETAADRRRLAARLMPLLDLTSLGEDDTPARIDALCAEALAAPVGPAAVCVYPEHVAGARRALGAAGIRVATVVNFPDGSDDAARVERETRRAVAAGADEVDMVLPWRALRDGRAEAARAAVAACRRACGPGIALKLIIESGELREPALIREACAIGLGEGVDFLKTSTGKVPINATPEAAAMMLEAIAAQGGRCGLKVAGGVRTLADAASYLDLVEARMGATWITPAHLRIGASALFAELRDALAPAA
jgi:deoxyribose-phosphate aldolase